MTIRLGYVAISKTLEDISYNHTITYTNLKKLSKEKQEQKLHDIILLNLKNLKQILKYNVQNKITFFRISHNFIPLATHPNVNYDYITPYIKIYKEIGAYIKKHNLRVDSHPDQFCVLNSLNEDIINSSISILTYQYQLYQVMELESFVILHIGSGKPNKEDAIKRFKETFYTLPKHIQNMILLENDDKTFTAKETLELCEQLQIPMVLDYHHYLCNKENNDIETLLPRILNTWKEKEIPPKMHFSSPKNKKEKRAHSITIEIKSFIKFLELLKKYNTDIDIMLECKGKDESLFRLSRQLKFYTKYKFINNSTFIM